LFLFSAYSGHRARRPGFDRVVYIKHLNSIGRSPVKVILNDLPLDITVGRQIS